jgi:hypothetical protein
VEVEKGIRVEGIVVESTFGEAHEVIKKMIYRKTLTAEC